MDLNAKASYFKIETNVLSGSQWCGKWIIESTLIDDTIASEIISFSFDAGSVVTASEVTQLENVGFANASTTLGQPLNCITGLLLTGTPSQGVKCSNIKLKVYDCNLPEPPDDCPGAFDSIKEFPVLPKRFSSVDDTDLLNIQMFPTGSERCEGTPADFDVDKFTYPLYLEDAYRTYDQSGNETGRISSGIKVYLCTVCAIGSAITFDWTGSFITDTGDQSLAEVAFMGIGSGAISINKFKLDHLLKGRERSITSKEGDNLPQLPTDGWTIVGTGTPWLRNAGFGSFNKSWTGFNSNQFTEVLDEGAEIVLENATIQQLGGDCIGLESNPESSAYQICKGIKRIKAKRQFALLGIPSLSSATSYPNYFAFYAQFRKVDFSDSDSSLFQNLSHWYSNGQRLVNVVYSNGGGPSQIENINPSSELYQDFTGTPPNYHNITFDYETNCGLLIKESVYAVTPVFTYGSAQWMHHVQFWVFNSAADLTATIYTQSIKQTKRVLLAGSNISKVNSSSFNVTNLDTSSVLLDQPMSSLGQALNPMDSVQLETENIEFYPDRLTIGDNIESKNIAILDNGTILETITFTQIAETF